MSNDTDGRKIRIIANPVAGGGRGLVESRRLAAAFESGGAAVEVITTRRRGDGIVAASTPGTDCIAAVGGDGTVNEVLNGMPLAIPLAILPVGTANVVSRELRLPREAAHLAELVFSGRLRRVDVGLCGARRFLLGAGAGLDAMIAEVVERRRGRRGHFVKWGIAAASVLLRGQYRGIRVEVDGRLVSDYCQYAIIGNCRYSAGLFPATPRAVIDDGLLDICLVGRLGVRRVAELLYAVHRPGFDRRPDLVYLQGRDIGLYPAAPDAPVAFQVDGDTAGHLPATFTVAHRALQVYTPI